MNGQADRRLMRRAVAAARVNLGRTWPGPVVGCVLSRDGRILAEAASGPGGRPHAEEQALAAVEAGGADAYVTLEPCGQRSNGAASCSERLIASGVRRVLVACANPEGLSAGRGLERLRAAGIEVEVGLMQDEAATLYRGFLHRLATGLPLVEAAAAGDGFDAAFRPTEGETVQEALRRYGAAGYTRLWTPAGGEVAQALGAEGFLDGSAGSR